MQRLKALKHVIDQRRTPTHTDSPGEQNRLTLNHEERTKHQTTIQPLTFLRNMEAAAPHCPSRSVPCRLTIHSHFMPAPHRLSTSFPSRPNLAYTFPCYDSLVQSFSNLASDQELTTCQCPGAGRPYGLCSSLLAGMPTPSSHCQAAT